MEAEEVEATDEEEAETQLTKQRLLELPSVWKAAEAFPDEPIVRYRYPDHKIRILWDRADELFRPRMYSVRLKPKKRQKDEVVYFEEDDVKITATDVARAIDNARKRVGDDYANLLVAKQGEGNGAEPAEEEA
jgi:hypothetical protein